MRNDDTLRDYLKEIGRSPLLTPPQEIGYSRQVQALIAVLPPPLTGCHAITVESVSKFLENNPSPESKRLAATGQRAKKILIERNLRLVVSVAKDYTNRGVALFDLIQEGNMGLARASEKFDPSKGYRFSTYAHWWIRQGITRAVAVQSRTIRLPVHMNEKLTKIKKATRELYKDHIPCTVENLAKKSGLPVGVVEFALESKRIGSVISLDYRLGDERDSGSFGDCIKSDVDALSDLEQELTADYVAQWLDKVLPEDQREILSLRYGIGGGGFHTWEDVARETGINRQKVRKIAEKGHRRLLAKATRNPTLRELA